MKFCFKSFVTLSILFVSLESSYAQDPKSEPYQSTSVPPNDLIIKKASGMASCEKNITEIIGKFTMSENLYQVFYYHKDQDGKTYWDDKITLYRFDNKKWFVVCGNGISGRSGGIITK